MARWDDDRAPYLRVAADLRARIMSGDLAGQLPTIKALMEAYGTRSNSVVQRAMEVLSAEGFVDTQQGKGNFVCADRIALIEATPHINLGDGAAKSSYVLLKVGDVEPPADVAQVLGIGSGELAALRKQVLVRPDGVPVELAWNFYLTEVAHGTALAGELKIKGGSKAVFEAAGHRYRAQEDVVTARAPTTEEVEILELPASVPVLRTLRVITDQDGSVLEVSVIVKGGHRYALRHHREIH